MTGSMAWARRSEQPFPCLLAFSVMRVWPQRPIPLNSKAYCPSWHWHHCPGSWNAHACVRCDCRCDSAVEGAWLRALPLALLRGRGWVRFAASPLTHVHRQIFSLKMHKFKFEDVLSDSRSSVSLCMKCSCSWNDCWC